MKNEKKLSIVIPTYNRSKKIIKLIKKFLEIINDSIEIIVVDDGSTDNTEEELKKIKNINFKFYKINNSERGFARNYGFSQSCGKYINFFDSDDEPFENHIEVANDIIKDNKYDIFHTSYTIAKRNKKNKNFFYNGLLNSKIIKKNIICLNNIFIKRQILIDNYFCEDRKLSGTEDWLLWIKLSKNYNINGINTITSKINDDLSRSTSIMNFHDLQNRIEYLNMFLNEDIYFQGELTTKEKKYILAEMNSILCLYSSFRKNKFYTIKLFLKSLILSFNTFFRIRNIIILKNILFKL